MHMEIFQTVTIALILGVTSFTLAKWLKFPAILLYLLSGILMGPMGLKVIRVESLGSGLFTLVEIGVAIILFEEGLSLSTLTFRTEFTSIRRIVLVTIPLTGLGAATMAHFFLDISWDLALFFGTLIVVTGPTVVNAILKIVNLTRRLEMLLHWESIWGDVVGVLLSALALELLIPAGVESLGRLGFILLLRILGGTFIGLVSGYLLGRFLLPWAERLADPALPGLLAVAGALGTFYASNVTFEASGPLAAAVAGFFLSHLKAEGLHSIRRFKEQLSTLFISTLFILLSASINPLEILPAWPMMLLIAFFMGTLVRP
ncbi:cation:proton antiporter, partial [Thermodesulfobacteriota bacterium]